MIYLNYNSKGKRIDNIWDNLRLRAAVNDDYLNEGDFLS